MIEFDRQPGVSQAVFLSRFIELFKSIFKSIALCYHVAMKKIVLIVVELFLLVLSCGIVFGFRIVSKHATVNKNIESIGSINYKYEDSNKYSIGSASIDDEISRINIDWIDGEVVIIPSNSNKISFNETCSAPLSDAMKVHYFVDRGLLNIKYCASGSWKIENLEKKLTVSIPSDILNVLEIECISSDIDISKVNANRFDIDSVSGNIDIADINLKNIEVNTISGNIKGNFDGQVSDASFETVSGNIELYYDSFKKLDIESISGDVALNPASELDATLEFESVSGDIFSDIPSIKKGKEYIYSSGRDSYSVDTVSGNLTVKGF